MKQQLQTMLWKLSSCMIFFHALSHKAPTARRNKREKVLSSGEKRSSFKNNVRMTTNIKFVS